MKPLLLVLGMGYSASRFVALHRGKFARVAATARSPDKIATLNADGFEALRFDGPASPELIRAAREATHVLASVPPNEAGDPVLNALGSVLAENAALQWIGYLSTTGVYGDREGAWTDEDAPLKPESARSVRRAAAEQDWLRLATIQRAVQVFRLSGIYGPGRNALAALKAGTERNLVKPGQVFNRIHVDDIAAVLAAAIERPHAGPVFNLADHEPAPSGDVVTFAAELLGISAPPAKPFDAANISEMAKSFWAENKRIAARRVERELGVELSFPTYREGLRSLFAAGEGR